MRQQTRVLAIEPEDPDRLAAFMAFRWLSALQESRRTARVHRRPGRRPGTRNGQARLMHSAVARIPAVFQPRVPEEIRRIAVVVPYVGHQFHTPSMMAVEQCAVLAREGCQVRIFSAQELTPPDAVQFRGDGRDLKLPPLNAQVWGKLLPAGVGMTISDNRFSLPGRWRKLMPVLAELRSRCGAAGGAVSLRWPPHCYTLRPMVGISVNSVPPIAPVDVWLVRRPASQAARRPGAECLPSALAGLYHPWKLRRSNDAMAGHAGGLSAWTTTIP
jgi:hypothetical protein